MTITIGLHELYKKERNEIMSNSKYYSITGMKFIRHAGVDSRMIILDELLACLIVQNNHPTVTRLINNTKSNC